MQARMLEYVPGKPFSRDNYWSLQKESVCQQNYLTTLGITPTSIDAVVPGYLAQRTARAGYQRFRGLARRG
jgi:NADH dehydrogenase